MKYRRAGLYSCAAIVANRPLSGGRTVRPTWIALVLSCLLVHEASAGGTLVDRVFHSAALDQDRHVMVYLPEHFDSSGSRVYPVVVHLHGMYGNHTSDANRIRTVLDAEISAGTVRPLIAVMPDGSVGGYDGTNWANSILYGRIQDYVADDVRRFIEDAYPVFALRSKRAALGYSMGGAGAMNLAFAHPDLYAAVASMSGALDYHHLADWFPAVFAEAGGVAPYRYDPANGGFTSILFMLGGAYSPHPGQTPFPADFPLDSLGGVIDSIWTAKWMPYGPQRGAARLPAGHPAIHFDCGTYDHLGLFEFNTAFAETLTLLGVPHVFEPFEGTHFDHLQASTRSAFLFADSVMWAGATSAVDPAAPRGSAPIAITVGPNPSRGEFLVTFRMAGGRPATLDVFDTAGRRVDRLSVRESPTGDHAVAWRPPARLVDGVYHLRVTDRGRTGHARAVVLR